MSILKSIAIKQQYNDLVILYEIYLQLIVAFYSVNQYLNNSLINMNFSTKTPTIAFLNKANTVRYNFKFYIFKDYLNIILRNYPQINYLITTLFAMYTIDGYKIFVTPEVKNGALYTSIKKTYNL